MAALLLLCLSRINASAQTQSLYNDIHAHEVGDVITVVLTENISGSSSTNASTRSNTAGSAESGISGNFVPFQPTFGADAQLTYDSDERIRADQQQLLQGTLSVRIQEVADNGDFIIAGQRSTEINGERHEMSVQGFVRPSDITQSNRVLSFRIADAQIKYLKEEGVGEAKRKTGIGRKLLWGTLGVVTAVAAFMAGGG
jgi:flagellar L-ring protein precursor FlgH